MSVDIISTACVVSHDRYFLDRVATSILDFEGAGKVTRYVGDYDTFRRLKAQREGERRAAAPAKKPKRERAPVPPREGLSSKEKRELRDLEGRIEAAEGELAGLDAELSDPALYAERAAEAPALTERREVLAGEIEALMTRWEELEEKK